MDKMRILLVDDETRYLSTTSRLFSRKGYDAVTAASGTEAFKILGSSSIHVVILDMKMPGMDGMEILKTIKRDFPLVEVIILTGHGTMESAVDGLKAGASDYMVKPAYIDDMIKKAEEAFDRRLRIEEKIRMARSSK
ncbi:MAG: response regulator [Deltaproteobacteria bacterium]|nr:response regulator [Deltaproteobacteria bacterium]